MKPPTPLPLTIAARRLRVPRAWLEREAKAGRLPHLDADGAILFDIALLREILLRRARETPQACT
ncbi:hypothetical protein RAS1_29090 [Phycisphaerae bacterium RAS1]|nr:hypothetical protein RAS1_29090 [Phycisphaerae bacterium RAS1]